CTFHLFNAYTPIIYHVEYVLINPAQFGLGDAIRDAAQESLSKLRARISKTFKENPNHQFETIARFNALIPGIKELIEERHIDLIVMGTQGATGTKEVLFGSNTVQVFRNIKCPIIAVPSDFEFESPQEILFPTDLEVEYQRTQLDILADIAKFHHSRINAMHVSTGYDLTEAQEDHKLQLEDMFKSSAFLFHDFESMEIADAINNFQVKHKINMLAMINNKHSFFENLFFKNTINQIGFHLNIPFLVIPSER
ncbi:MAG TPA: universal stress protein, partial [Flavobacteriaceae bacterium]|nr:universal stress protein [Flavobacteriaceae bacterium]